MDLNVSIVDIPRKGGSDMKSPEMEEFLEDASQHLFGRSRKGQGCVTCGSIYIEPEDFRDALSLKEWSISHMCQMCQDSVFVQRREDE